MDADPSAAFVCGPRVAAGRAAFPVKRHRPPGSVTAAVNRLAERFTLDDEARDRLGTLTIALAAEVDPPTAIREPAAIVERHIADSLVALDLEAVGAARRVADLGSGAGFPGLPLAIGRAEARFDLVEASRRKCAVIDRLAEACALSNVTTIAERAETHAAAGGARAYDLVCARALAPLAVLVEYAGPLLREGGALVAWKGGRDATEEHAGAAAAERVGLRAVAVERVLPFEGARARHLHVLRKERPTPAGFPRRPGRAASRPLA